MSNASLKFESKRQVLDKLLATLGWQLEDRSTEAAMVGDGLVINLCGLAASRVRDGVSVTGSAGAIGESPLTERRASFELIERILLVEAMGRNAFSQTNLSGKKLDRSLSVATAFPTSPQPDLWQFAKSNGIALHENWRDACAAAALELVERHVVMASWMGALTPQVIGNGSELGLGAALAKTYDIVVVEFARMPLFDLQKSAHVHGVFLFPQRPLEAPLAYGFGAAFDAGQASQHAAREACQRLGFLSGIPLPVTAPDFQAHPLYHQDFFLQERAHQLLRQWLAGLAPRTYQEPITPLKIEFFDLSHPSHKQLFLAKAWSSAAIPLVFGQCPLFAYEGLSAERKIHPIV